MVVGLQEKFLEAIEVRKFSETWGSKVKIMKIQASSMNKGYMKDGEHPLENIFLRKFCNFNGF